ncbi:serine/threonine protein kinase [Pajaroellobacter abortibovis]|nr:serine/threonine-protein kinase [Pajaroellobacter abortibovis]
MRLSFSPDNSTSIRYLSKEEIRISTLKPYLLRLQAEKGEQKVEEILNAAGICSSGIMRNEHTWISEGAALQVLRCVIDLLGPDALTDPGHWITHSDALGYFVQMLCHARNPSEAYRYWVSHGQEITRLGEWKMEQDESVRWKLGGRAHSIRVAYKPHEALRKGEGRRKISVQDEELLCAVRRGGLVGIPRIWGLREATVIHPICLAHGDAKCVYEIRWETPRVQWERWVVFGVMTAVGGWIIGGGGDNQIGLWMMEGVALAGAAACYRWDVAQLQKNKRIFVKNHVKALERGLELYEKKEQVPTELSGSVLRNKYRIGCKIGMGGVGVVYEAQHITLGHEVAVKILRSAAAKDENEFTRLWREAYVQVHIKHPHIVRVFDLDQMPDGSLYVVMERLEGCSLADKLTLEGVMAPRFAVPVFIAVCRALTAAHREGVIHRDLKPANVFLCRNGVAKVLDFGMSKLLMADSITESGYTIGTPEYMAPEQCIGATVEPRTDLYSLGVLMYESLTGKLPILAPTRRELLELHQRQIPLPIRQCRRDLPIPEALEAAIMKCLNKRASQRPTSAQELEVMLSSIPLEDLVAYYPPSVARGIPSSQPSHEDPPIQDAAQAKSVAASRCIPSSTISNVGVGLIQP